MIGMSKYIVWAACRDVGSIYYTPKPYTRGTSNMTLHNCNPPAPEIQPYKTCGMCNKEYPATKEYFYANSRGKYKLTGRCKSCLSELQKTKKDRDNANARKRYAANPEKYREAKRHERKVNGDAINAKRRETYSNNIEVKRKKGRDGYSKYRVTIRLRAQQKRQLNPEIGRKRHQDWRKANPEKAKQSYANWAKNNRDKVRMIYQRRETRKRNLPYNYTDKHWHTALDYFHGCCAICGRQMRDLFGKHIAAMDHWIPLSSPECPGTIPTNIVPLCHGVGGCNNSKRDKLPIDWLVKQFGKRRGKTIQAKIEQFFTYMNDLFTDSELAG